MIKPPVVMPLHTANDCKQYQNDIQKVTNRCCIYIGATGTGLDYVSRQTAFLGKESAMPDYINRTIVAWGLLH